MATPAIKRKAKDLIDLTISPSFPPVTALNKSKTPKIIKTIGISILIIKTIYPINFNGGFNLVHGLFLVLPPSTLVVTAPV